MTAEDNPWTGYGLRASPPRSGRTPVGDPPPFLQAMVDEGLSAAAQPFVGISTSGIVEPGLFSQSRTVPTAPILAVALQLVAQLGPEERSRATHPIDAPEKRLWFNIHPNLLRHGLLLEDLSMATRQACLRVMEATLSVRGYQQARDIMRLNGLLAALTKSPDEFGEWPYWFTLFGEPSPDEPWGWQIDGHHLNLNCLVLPDRIVFTPSFMGSEPCRVVDGPLAGTSVLVPEEKAGLDLIRSLDDQQLATAVLRTSIEPGQLPTELQHPVDGRMVAGAFKDNAVIPSEGLRGSAMTDAQRRLLLDVVGAYVGWAEDAHAEVKLDEVQRHLDDTYFAWMGARGDAGPFYYRLQSPVVLIEFDHHPGIVWDNLVPTQNHIHSIMRTPNSGDYGADLLRRHYERFDHSADEHSHDGRDVRP